MDRSKPAPSGSSSEDLDRARSLSQRLKGVAPAGGAAEPGQAYVSFGAVAAPAATPALPPAPRALALPPPPARAAPAPPAIAPVHRLASPVTAPAPRPSLPLMPRREPLRAPSTGFGPVAWNRLLDGCAATVGADTAFLMDPHGLVVASRGGRDAAELEGVGARLMVAFEQADHIEGGPVTLSLTVESPRGTLHGLRLKLPEGGLLTLGLLVPGGLTADRQARLLALVAASAAV